jgi:hypothetical protein
MLQCLQPATVRLRVGQLVPGNGAGVLASSGRKSDSGAMSPSSFHLHSPINQSENPPNEALLGRHRDNS